MLPSFEDSAAMNNAAMDGDESTPVKPAKKVTMHTRRGHKQNQMMKEAERATNEPLMRIAEASHQNHNAEGKM